MALTLNQEEARRRLGLLIALATCLALPVRAQSQASPYVPTLDLAYRDLDALVAFGLAEGLVLSQRPYSRMTFARVIADVRPRMAADEGVPKARVLEALERLEASFAGERALLCDGPQEECPRSPPAASLRGAAVDGTWADSPFRTIASRYNGNPDFIDADLNPLLQKNQGRTLADGWTVAGEGWLDLVAGSRIAGQIQPRVWLAGDRGGDRHRDATLVRAHARGLLGNLSIEAGRNHLSHGHARDLGPLFSGNARGLDMIRLSLERPARLPWIFRGLGPVGFSGLLADMGRNQDTPSSKLIVWELGVRPHRNLEIGLALVDHQGGEGSPPASWRERLQEAFFILNRRPFYFLPQVGEVTDKTAGLDVRLTVPSRGLDLYLEMVTTDDHDVFKGAGEALWNDAAWTAGLRMTGLGDEGRLDAWVEGSRVGVRPYTHHQFTSGLTLDGRVLGSPLGPLGAGIEAGVEWTGTHHRLSTRAAWERYQGDTYVDVPGSPVEFIRIEDNPDEVRIRASLDWTRQRAASRLRTTLRLGYEHVTRFDFTRTIRSNFLAQAGVGYVR